MGPLDGPLGKHKKQMRFSQKAKKYLLDVYRTGEETSKKSTASSMAFQIWSLRDDTGQKCCIGSDRLVDRAAARWILQSNICPDKSWFIEEVFLCKYE